MTLPLSVGLDGNAVAAGIGVLAEEQVADQVALDDGKPAAVIEIRHRDAGRRFVDEVARDHRALTA